MLSSKDNGFAWRNWIARGTSNPKVAGSNPVANFGGVGKLEGGVFGHWVRVAQLDSAWDF